VEFCTIVARNYLAHARVLAASLTEHYPDRRLVVLVIDDDDTEVDARAEPFDVLRPGDLDLDRREFRHMAMIYDVLELATALKPWLMARVLERGSPTCYLDADIQVFGTLEDVERLVERHGIVLTPHLTCPMPRDDLQPGEREILLAGAYNLGFLALSPDTEPFLAWWSERLRRHCRNAQHEGAFVDQRWIDLVPGYFEHVVYKDQGANVAYWNLSSRRVKRVGCRYAVNGSPLRFFHFSGFDPMRPHLLSKHQGDVARIRLEEHEALAQLCQRYATALLGAGYLDALGTPYRYDYTADGMRIDARMRRVYRDALLVDERSLRPSALPDPFDRAGAPAFLRWIARPSGATPAPGIPRYLRAVCEERADLQAEFGDLAGAGGDRFLEWMAKHGRTDAGVPPECIPMWAYPDPPHTGGGSSRPGVNVVGYLDAENGVGAVTRALVDVLREAQVPYSAVRCADTPAGPPFGGADAPEGGVNVVCINADELPVVTERLGDRMPPARHRIGIWAWEVEVFPEWMGRSSRFVDEVWAYSRHAAAAIAPAIDVPVHVFRPPVRVPPAAPAAERAALGMPEGFVVMFCFDFHSVFERKNPLGVLAAYSRAFTPNDGAHLVIKGFNGASNPIALARLRAAAENRSDVTVLNGHVSADRQEALVRACDCYVSLHRAEGYGLTMAEAMALGKPVVATRYSGNLEFMTDDTAILVPYDLVPVPIGCRPYPAGTLWAEPDLDAAACALQELAADPERRMVLGERAREHIRERHSPAARVAWVLARLNAVAAR
jgi:glycosyltransferase involved in cell wall biosynthesis